MASHSRGGYLLPGCDLGRPAGKPFPPKPQPGSAVSLPRKPRVEGSGHLSTTGNTRDEQGRARAAAKCSFPGAFGAGKHGEDRACFPAPPGGIVAQREISEGETSQSHAWQEGTRDEGC